MDMRANSPLRATGYTPTAVHCSTCSLGKLCLGRGISAPELAIMADLVTVRKRVKRGATLVSGGQNFEFLYALRSGSLKSTVVDESGAEQIIGFHMAGDIVGFDGIDGGAHTVATVALEDSEVCAVRFSDLERAAAAHASIQKQFVRLMSRELTRKNGIMLLLGTMSAEEKIITFLLILSARLAERGFSPKSFILRMTREEIGNYLGLTIETVSRILARLHKRGLVSVHLREIELLNPDELKALAKRSPKELSDAC